MGQVDLRVPFAQLWYLVSLFWRLWRPRAPRCDGPSSSTSSSASSSTTPRSVGSSPSTGPPCTCPILCGFLMRKHACFFPSAKTLSPRLWPSPLVFNVGCASWPVTYGMRVEVWFRAPTRRGVRHEVGVRRATSCALRVDVLHHDDGVCAIRNPRLSESWRGEERGEAPDVEGQTKPPPAPKANARAGKRRGAISDDGGEGVHVRKWGPGAVPFVMHMAVLLLV